MMPCRVLVHILLELPIAAVELLGRLREIDAAMGMWTADLLLGEGLRVRHLLVDEGDSD